MTFSQEQLEWIVAEVIRRLTAQSVRVAGDERSLSPECHELVIDDRVVTMQLIEGRLAGVTQIAVPRRAVVTPAVKDELKQRRIELIFTAEKNAPPT